VNILSADFLISAPDLDSCPPSDLPEFAFIGRSNVGKSSMINMLTNRKSLAKVSGTPGKTSLINFFTINRNWSLVDLPGYGYAKVSKKERSRFSAAIGNYLQHRPNLMGTFVLIDSMLSPQKIDLEFGEWMVHAGLPFALVFTKADRLSDTAATKNREGFLERFQKISADAPDVIVTSSKLRTGRSELLALIGSALPGANESNPSA
jgi:GTP-binding protein